ncbi:hypothetical protein ACX0GZ_05215 [Sphingomonas aestuarii]
MIRQLVEFPPEEVKDKADLRRRMRRPVAQGAPDRGPAAAQRA